jgi:hypothetical protein
MDNIRTLRLGRGKRSTENGVPNIDVYLNNDQIKIVSHTDWHVKESASDPQID